MLTLTELLTLVGALLTVFGLGYMIGRDHKK